MTELARIVGEVSRAVIDSAEQLNYLDGVAGDGDLGVTMSTAGNAILSELSVLQPMHPADLLQSIGVLIAEEAPSTAGTLLASALIAVASYIGSTPDSSPTFLLAGGLDAAAAAIQTRGRAAQGERTMLDALIPASAVAADADRNGAALADALRSASLAADMGAAETATMTARHGRAGWTPDRAFGSEDAGARLVAIVLSAASAALEDPSAVAEIQGSGSSN